MDSWATQQCNMSSYVYVVYWLPPGPGSSPFLLVRKCSLLAERILITPVMRHARTQKFQMSGSTVHSYTVRVLQNIKNFMGDNGI